MEDTWGTFMEPQNFSVNDGNGIRTVIFFAGCPLRCRWCSNPESYTCDRKIAHHKSTCIQCGSCARVCPKGVGMDLNSSEGRRLCCVCGLCVKVCPTNSRRDMVYRFGSEELLSIIEKQRIFYRYSGGGVTFSGGEAAMQEDMLRELVYKLYDKSIDMALETSGCFVFDEVKDILERLDLIFIDIKHMDDSRHRLYTGIGNEGILGNITRLDELGIPVVVRIPLIEGVNADEEHIQRTARFLRQNMKRPRLELLPYHQYGEEKYEALGMKKPPKRFKAPTEERIRVLHQIIEGEGVEIASYK